LPARLRPADAPGGRVRLEQKVAARAEHAEGVVVGGERVAEVRRLRRLTLVPLEDHLVAGVRHLVLQQQDGLGRQGRLLARGARTDPAAALRQAGLAERAALQRPAAADAARAGLSAGARVIVVARRAIRLERARGGAARRRRAVRGAVVAVFG